MSRRALLAAALLAAACSRGAAPGTAAPGARPVAVVNGEALSADAVRRELAQLAAGEAEVPAALKRRALDGAVERTLLVQEARARGAKVTDDEVEQAFAAVKAEYPGAHFDELLAQQKTTAPEVKARLRDQLLVERVVGEELAKVKVTDAEVRAHYDANPQEFADGEQVRALHLVTRTKEEAEKARAEIARRPASFGDVARRVSISPEGQRGGDLGWFGKASGMPEVFATCFTLKKDQLSPVVASPYGFHVFKVVDRRPAARRPFEAVAGELGQRLLTDRRARAQEDFLAQLKARAKIDIDEPAYEAAVRGTP